MANNNKHRERSRRSHNNSSSRAGMNYLEWAGSLKTDRKKKMKEMRSLKGGE